MYLGLIFMTHTKIKINPKIEISPNPLALCERLPINITKFLLIQNGIQNIPGAPALQHHNYKVQEAFKDFIQFICFSCLSVYYKR